MRVTIQLADGRFSIDEESLAKLARKVLKNESRSRDGIGIVYCGDSMMERLSKKFKGNKRPTDVLAFDLRDEFEPNSLGEIYVNLQMARRQAAHFNVPYLEEVRRLTVHGVLHLLGYRDDNLSARDKMWKRQERYLHNGKEV